MLEVATPAPRPVIQGGASPLWCVTTANFESVVDRLVHTPVLASDLETTGLSPFRGDRVFGVAFADEEREWYFNFNDDRPQDNPLPRSWLMRLAPIYAAPGVLINHNLKFDGHFWLDLGFELRRELWCTMALARVEFNEHLKYSLDACAQRIGKHKDDTVKKYLDEHKDWEWESVPGKKTRSKRYFFARVPLPVIGPYACQDARAAYDLYTHQRASFADTSTSGAAPGLDQVVANERRLTRVCLDIEHRGLKVDVGYCRAALAHEQSRMSHAQREFQALAGMPLVDSAMALGPVLREAGLTLGKTATGKESIAEDVLITKKGHVLVDLILQYRDAQKRSNTYFSNFLTLSDDQGRIHADLRQGGTATGRFAAGNPNLQNLNAEDDSPFPVRRAFVPDEDMLLVSIDYAQMEYRLMLDYAQEMGLIEKVLSGIDVHEATAQVIREMGVPMTRQQAKNINFALLYGAGTGKLAQMMKCTVEQAAEMKGQYFRALRRIQGFIRQVIRTTEKRGYIFNWMGRRCYFPNPEFAYKAPNYLIQGGSADIVKKAMVDVDQFLRSHQSRMVLNIHDEIWLLMPRHETGLIPDVVKLMVQAYPHKTLPMECSVSWSDRSGHDLIEGVPA
jgi:DNA polymerase-1